MKLKKAHLILLASVLVTLILYIIPFGATIAYPLVLISTMVHEFGHGIAALMVGGSFNSYHMWPDGSGQALIASPGGGLRQAFISAGGLVGPSIAATVLFVTASYAKLCRAALYMLVGCIVIGEAIVIRGWFAMIFAAVFGIILLFIAKQKNLLLAQSTLVFVAVQLSLSVFSRSDYLFTRTAMTAQGPMPSDVFQMQQALYLPYWFWGLLCTVFSLGTLFFGLRYYIKKS